MSSNAIKILQGEFGRVSLLDMQKPLVIHAHHHCHVLIKIHEADCAFLVKGKLQPLNRDTVVLINAWEPHGYQHTPDGQGRSILLALYLEPSWLGKILNSLTMSAHSQFFPRSCVILPSGARKLADRLAELMLVSMDVPPDILEEHIFDLFIAIAEQHSLLISYADRYKLRSDSSMDKRIRTAIEKMRRNPNQGEYIGQIASESGLSRSHFFELFRRSTNVTPVVYMNTLRVESAISSLCVPDRKISDISYDMGFSSPGHFTRFFRQHLGISPSEYRKVVDLINFEIDI